MGGKKKYINIFGSITEPFNWVQRWAIPPLCNGSKHKVLMAIAIRMCYTGLDLPEFSTEGMEM